jgi:hypothetical protein
MSQGAVHEVDRRIIFVLVFLALAIPLYYRYQIKPAPMPAAQKLFDVVETLKTEPGDIAFIALDFGPNTKAENEAQAEVVIEHLMRRRVPVALFSLYYLASPFMVSVPERIAERLMKEYPGERWEYGKDCVYLGYPVGGYLRILSIPKSDNLVELFGKDVRGNNLSDIPAFRSVNSLKQIKLLAEFTGLVGVFDTYVQFFKGKDYNPSFVHGCTSITIPEAFIYLESDQIQGLLEGIAGAAWYSELLNRRFTSRTPDQSAVLNTGLGVAHLVIIMLVLVGNSLFFIQRRQGR